MCRVPPLLNKLYEWVFTTILRIPPYLFTIMDPIQPIYYYILMTLCWLCHLRLCLNTSYLTSDANLPWLILLLSTIFSAFPSHDHLRVSFSHNRNMHLRFLTGPIWVSVILHVHQPKPHISWMLQVLQLPIPLYFAVWLVLFSTLLLLGRTLPSLFSRSASSCMTYGSLTYMPSSVFYAISEVPWTTVYNFMFLRRLIFVLTQMSTVAGAPCCGDPLQAIVYFLVIIVG